MANEASFELVLGGATLRMRVSSASDVGKVRMVNEDSLLASPPVFFVADGMGGHALGDRASQTVVEIFEKRFGGIESTTSTAVVSAISRANEAVAALTADAADGRAVAGTTLAGIALVSPGSAGATDPGAVRELSDYRWMTFNVGDSRVYDWDGSTLSQVTVDHSAVQELVQQGMITQGEAATHPQRNVITRAIGVDDFVNADIWLRPVRGKQSYLLCSDGLTKELDDAEIAAVLRTSEGNPAEQLVAAALSAGGADNVTAVVVESDVVAGDDSGDAIAAAALQESLEDTLPRRQRIR